MAGLGTFLKWSLFTKDNSNILCDEADLEKTLPVKKLTDEEIGKFCDEDTTNKIRVIWIGHATTLVNMDNFIFITDPVFSERSAPSQLVGPKRHGPVPITIYRIPNLHAVLISHNHYDHLDTDSVRKLNDKFSNKLHWFCGVGNADWFRSVGISENVHELTWWQSEKVRDMEFVFTPAQHWCARGLLDRNRALWGSWTVIGPKKRFFFAGDTGYCAAFAEIGKKYGKFDLASIPIGAYEPRWMMEPQHVDPAQAVQIHVDVKSNHSVGCHWGTFRLTNEVKIPPNHFIFNISAEKKAFKFFSFKLVLFGAEEQAS